MLSGIQLNAQKLRMPVSLGFDQKMDDSLKNLFRQEIARRRIDTINRREGIRIMSEEMRSKVETAIQNGTMNSRVMNTMQPRFYVLDFFVLMTDQSIDKISWKAFSLPDARPDTARRHFPVPDSLRAYPEKAIAAGIDKMFKTRPF
jgi:hypothetical protein